MGHVGSVICNNGDNIYIPNIVYDTAGRIGLQDSYFHYSNGENYAIRPNWANYITMVNSKGAIGSNYNAVYNTFVNLRTSQPSAYWSSGAGKVELDKIQNKSAWIWGSLSEGGVLLCKDEQNLFYLAAFRGIYQDTRSGYEDYIDYWFQFGFTRGLTQSELLTGYLVSYGDPKPLFIFFQPTDLVYKVFNYTELIPSFELKPIEGAMSIPNWVDVLPAVSTSGVMPLNMFVAATSEGWERTSQGYMKVADDDEGAYPYYDLVAGSIWGGSSFNYDENPYGSTSTTSPNGTDWDNTSDDIPFTDEDQFTTDALNTGFYTLYNPTEGEIRAFNNYLFTDITDAMSQVLKRLIADPIEYVVFCAMCHFTPVSSTTENISFCGLNTGIAANKISRQMQEIDCGSVELFYWKDGIQFDDTSSFLSYDPYYKIQIYLPYIGIKDLKTSDVMRGTLTVKYWVDLLTGACIAQLRVDRTSRDPHDVYLGAIIAEFTGNVYEHLPMSSTDWRGMATSIMQFAGGAASVATGNAAGLGTIASAVMAEKVTVARSGQLAANYGYMGQQTPYLIISRPINQTPENFKAWEGLPSNITYKIGTLHGYTELDPDTLWVNDFDGILEEEAEMIRQITSSGFYV